MAKVTYASSSVMQALNSPTPFTVLRKLGLTELLPINHQIVSTQAQI